MVCNKKRKFPSQALRAAQLQNTYVPLKHARSDDGKRQVLFGRCVEARLPVNLTFPVMTPGYVGEPKGAAHIAFERRLFYAPLKLPNGKKVSFSGSKVQEAEAAELNEAQEAVASTIIVDHC